MQKKTVIILIAVIIVLLISGGAILGILVATGVFDEKQQLPQAAPPEFDNNLTLPPVASPPATPPTSPPATPPTSVPDDPADEVGGPREINDKPDSDPPPKMPTLEDECKGKPFTCYFTRYQDKTFFPEEQRWARAGGRKGKIVEMPGAGGENTCALMCNTNKNCLSYTYYNNARLPLNKHVRMPLCYNFLNTYENALNPVDAAKKDKAISGAHRGRF